jgi:hypothetical protein
VKRHNRSSYRSGLEEKIAEQLSKKKVSFEYEPSDKKIVYTIPESAHKYTPDFVLTKKDGTNMYVESKGIFDRADRMKHLLIRQQHPELDIRFVFSRSKARIRKGSKTTYAMICEGLGRAPFKGVTWRYADKLIPGEWLNE